MTHFLPSTDPWLKNLLSRHYLICAQGESESTQFYVARSQLEADAASMLVV